jgi:hypothetical protein
MSSSFLLSPVSFACLRMLFAGPAAAGIDALDRAVRAHVRAVQPPCAIVAGISGAYWAAAAA